MPENHDDIRKMLGEGNVDEAIRQINNRIAQRADDDVLFYLRGNAYRKKTMWQQAMEDYMEAVRLNPDSPALSALEMVNDILDFYDKNIYGQ